MDNVTLISFFIFLFLSTPSGLEDVSHYPELLATLLASGEWTELQLKKLAGLNLLRVMSTAEQVRQDSILDDFDYPTDSTQREL